MLSPVNTRKPPSTVVTITCVRPASPTMYVRRMITHSRAVSANGNSHTTIAISQPANTPRISATPNVGGTTSIAAVFKRVERPVLDHLGAREHEREHECADDVRGEHRDPQPPDVRERVAIAPPHQRQDHRQRVLGEELLPAEDHDHEAELVAERGDERHPARVWQIRAQ